MEQTDFPVQKLTLLVLLYSDVGYLDLNLDFFVFFFNFELLENSLDLFDMMLVPDFRIFFLLFINSLEAGESKKTVFFLDSFIFPLIWTYFATVLLSLLFLLKMFFLLAFYDLIIVFSAILNLFVESFSTFGVELDFLFVCLSFSSLISSSISSSLIGLSIDVLILNKFLLGLLRSSNYASSSDENIDTSILIFDYFWLLESFLLLKLSETFDFFFRKFEFFGLSVGFINLPLFSIH